MVLTVDEKRYGRLLAKALPVMIRTEAENEKTLLQIEILMDKGDGRSPEEDRLLELLTRLSSDFEAANYDFGASKPNEVLAFLLEKRGMKQVDLLQMLGCSRGALSDILTGRRQIARGPARKLAEFFRLPLDLFI
jgi:HTH-type transcriptional regulator/antitoxin HigA